MKLEIWIYDTPEGLQGRVYGLYTASPPAVFSDVVAIKEIDIEPGEWVQKYSSCEQSKLVTAMG